MSGSGRTPRRRSSPAVSPRSCGWELRWAPSRRNVGGAGGRRRSGGHLHARRTRATGSFGERLGQGGTMESALTRRGRSRRRGRHVVSVGARAGVELRRRDAAHRCGAPGLSRGTVRRRGGGAAARAQHQAGVRTMSERPVTVIPPAASKPLARHASSGAAGDADRRFRRRRITCPPTRPNALDSYGRALESDVAPAGVGAGRSSRAPRRR